MAKEYEKHIDYTRDDEIDGSILTESNSLRYYRGKAYIILNEAFETQCEDLRRYPYGSRHDLSLKEENNRLKIFISTFRALDDCVGEILSGEYEKIKADALREYTIVFDDDSREAH